MGISLVRSEWRCGPTEFFLPFDLNDLRVMDDDFTGTKPDILEGMPNDFICVVWGSSVEFHGAKSGVFLKYLNPIEIQW